jgi:hypothetical protein
MSGRVPSVRLTVLRPPWSLSGVTFGECVCGLPSKLAHTRLRVAPPVPTGYTLCRATVGKAVNGQGKHPHAKRSKALLKGIRLGVKFLLTFLLCTARAALTAARQPTLFVRLRTGQT